MKSGINLLLLDLECTCNDQPPLPSEDMEIIEIGAVVGKLRLDSFELLGRRQIYVLPQWHQALTPFCKDLTGIQQQDVDQAPPLKEAIQLLECWMADYDVRIWGSWGKFDQRHFSSETRLKELQSPLEPLQHINMKQLFARKRGHRVGLARAVQLSGLEFLGRHHSGVDDARNIAQLLENDGLLREAVLARL
ncbi:exonuclease domain-containing protein [Microbulbifer harenosus]|uniref:Exonuclease domain-containing protein n=1 Tax=Microbulbifer harenosus TaxID=2576840 RepID=A0ABY2UQ65_9GAMM|nr:3'-5' exonuclease [Microbulbifer harenosus]TLM79159.1 exonuclease domain-containing protein [Microbulbifer harenosus]